MQKSVEVKIKFSNGKKTGKDVSVFINDDEVHNSVNKLNTSEMTFEDISYVLRGLLDINFQEEVLSKLKLKGNSNNEEVINIDESSETLVDDNTDITETTETDNTTTL